jgi:hypothetical protein
MWTLLFGLIGWVVVSLAIGLLMILRNIPAKSFSANFLRIRLHAVPVSVGQKRFHRRAF